MRILKQILFFIQFVSFVYPQTVRHTVGIYVKIDSFKSGYGTGFYCDANGSIATAYHVIMNAKEIMILPSNYKNVEIKVRAIDSDHDLAILQIMPVQNTPSYALKAMEPKVDSKLTVIGCPRGIGEPPISGLF